MTSTVNEKVKFDPSNADHLKAFKHLRDFGKWPNGNKFILEWPFLDVPTMAQSKIVSHALTILLKD